MSSKQIDVTIIVPTHNRSAQLRRTLTSLASQTYPSERTEVIVVADGCTDDTTAMLSAFSAPFHLRPLTQTRRGPAAARNYGAALATGEWLIFLDDDIEADPGLVEAHLRILIGGPGRVVIGYLAAVTDRDLGLFGQTLRLWWERMFDTMRQPGHRFTYDNLLSGNFSLSARLLNRVGLFNPTLHCHEDYDLGYRLIQAGAHFQFAPAALGHHRERTDLSRSLQRKFAEGRADVTLSRLHPALRPALPLARFDQRRLGQSLVMTTAFSLPAIGDRLAARLQQALGLLERLRLRRRWRQVLYTLLDYWYWRGVQSEISSLKALTSLLEQAPPPAVIEMELDLAHDLTVVEGYLDEARPDAVRLRYDRWPVGMIAAQPGAEPLRGAHLRPRLESDLAEALLIAQTMAATVNRSSRQAAAEPQPQPANQGDRDHAVRNS